MFNQKSSIDQDLMIKKNITLASIIGLCYLRYKILEAR